MSSERQIIIFILIASALAVLYLAVYAWRKKNASGQTAIYLTLVLVAVAVYNFGYGMEISNDALKDVMLWVRFEHIGVQLMAPAWLLFAVSLTGRDKLITPRRIILLSIIPVVLFLLAQTLGNFNWLHRDPHMTSGGPFPIFTAGRTVFMYIGIIYQSACLATGMVLFTIMLFRSAPAIRSQAVILWFGSLLPWVGGILYNLGLAPYNLDLTPFALTLSVIVISVGFNRYHLLDIVPLARDVIFEGMSDGVLVLDNRNRIIDFNARLTTIFPSVKKASIGSSVFDSLITNQPFLDFIRRDNADSVEFEVNHLPGSCYYQGTVAPLYNWQGMRVGKIITFHDHTQTRQLLDKLEELATRDSLTGVYNRRHFTFLAENELYRLQRYGGVLSLIMLDLDFFKSINDTYSHAAGDLALKNVTETCRSVLRHSDIIGRLGGEEFAVLMPETGDDAASAAAEKLRREIETHPVYYEGHAIGIAASFGVSSVAAPHLVSLSELMRCADRGVYQAKSAGRNRIAVCNPSPNNNEPTLL